MAPRGGVRTAASANVERLVPFAPGTLRASNKAAAPLRALVYNVLLFVSVVAVVPVIVRRLRLFNLVKYDAKHSRVARGEHSLGPLGCRSLGFTQRSNEQHAVRVL